MYFLRKFDNNLLFALIVTVACGMRVNAQSWEKVAPATAIAPSPRYNTSMVYDETGNTLLVFGGRGNSGNLNEVWQFNLDSNTWSDITPSDSNQPAPRFAHNGVFIQQNRMMYVWSGQGIGFYNDVWAFDVVAKTWQELIPSGAIPNPRYGSAAVFDPTGQRILIFAGFTDAGRFGDTRGYDIITNTWTDLTPESNNPQIRCLHTASYDAIRHRMIIYGGQRSGPLDDLWAFDINNQTWSNLTPQLRPSGRIFPSSIYANDRFIVFGGSTSGGNVNDLWSYDFQDSSWSPINASGQLPGSRNSHAAVYVPKENAMYMFGGAGDSVYNDLWKFSDIPSSVEAPIETTGSFSLRQNYPNPFNPVTSIEFSLDEGTFVELKIFNILGQEVAQLVNGILLPGKYVKTWNAEAMPGGTYMYRLRTQKALKTQNMLLIR